MVVVGAGACGLTAALAARDAGAEVVVLERDASPSGSTALSSGFVPAAPTRFQKGNDSAELMAADVTRKNHGKADRRIVEAVCRASGPTIEWLADRHGPNGDFFKGLIQLAGAFVHLQKERLRPSAALFKLARNNLQKYPARHEHLDVMLVLGLIESWLGWLEGCGFAANPLRERPAPRLALLTG